MKHKYVKTMYLVFITSAKVPFFVLSFSSFTFYHRHHVMGKKAIYKKYGHEKLVLFSILNFNLEL